MCNGSENLLHHHDPEQDHDGVEDSVHEGHKNHKCEACGKSFSNAENLKRHFNTIHEGHKYLEDFNEMTRRGDEFIDVNGADAFLGFTEDEKEKFAKENILTFQN